MANVSLDVRKFLDFQSKFVNAFNRDETTGAVRDKPNECLRAVTRPGVNGRSVEFEDYSGVFGSIKSFFSAICRWFRRTAGCVFGTTKADAALKEISAAFQQSVVDIFGGKKTDVPPEVWDALGVHAHDGGKMRPLTSHRIGVVSNKIYFLWLQGKCKTGGVQLHNVPERPKPQNPEAQKEDPEKVNLSDKQYNEGKELPPLKPQDEVNEIKDDSQVKIEEKKEDNNKKPQKEIKNDKQNLPQIEVEKEKPEENNEQLQIVIEKREEEIKKEKKEEEVENKTETKEELPKEEVENKTEEKKVEIKEEEKEEVENKIEEKKEEEVKEEKKEEKVENKIEEKKVEIKEADKGMDEDTQKLLDELFGQGDDKIDEEVGEELVNKIDEPKESPAEKTVSAGDGVKVLEEFSKKLENQVKAADLANNYLKNLKETFEREKDRYLKSYKEDLGQFKLNESGRQAAVDRMAELLGNKMKEQLDAARKQVEEAKRMPAEGPFEERLKELGDKFSDKKVEDRKNDFLAAADEEKQKIADLIKGFQEGSSEAFKSFAKEYFNTRELETLVKNAVAEAYPNAKEPAADKLFETNKKLFGTLKNGILKGVGEGEEWKEFRENAAGWLDEVIKGKTSGFEFKASMADRMETGGKKVAEKVLQGFQAKVKEFQETSESAKEGYRQLDAFLQVGNNEANLPVNVDIESVSWLDPESRAAILSAFRKGYCEELRLLAKTAVFEESVKLEDITSGKCSLAEATETMQAKARQVNDGLTTLQNGKKEAEEELRAFVKGMGSYVWMLPEDRRPDFTGIMSAKIVEFLEGSAFSAVGKKEHSVYDKLSQFHERLIGMAQHALSEKGFPEFSTVRLQFLSEIEKGKKTVQEFTGLLGSTSEKLKAWTYDDTIYDLTAAFNASITEAFMNVLNAPRNDEADAPALSGILDRAAKVAAAMKKVSLMIDFYCGSVKDDGFEHEKMSLWAKNQDRLVEALSAAMSEIIVKGAGIGGDTPEEDILRVFGKKIRDDVAPYVTLLKGVLPVAQEFDLENILAAVRRNQPANQPAQSRKDEKLQV